MYSWAKNNTAHLFRFGFFILLALCVGLILLFWIKEHNRIEYFQAAYPYIDISRHLIAQEHFVTNLQPLSEQVRSRVREYEVDGRKASLYIEFLNTGANISVNPETYIWPASLAKVPMSIAVMKKVEEGTWHLASTLTLEQGDINRRAGSASTSIAHRLPGSRVTIETLLSEMLVHSDNTAYYMFLRSMDAATLQRFVDEVGLETLFSDEGKISAKEYARLLRSLYTASFLSRANSQLILQWLDESPFNDFISFELATQVPFPHKYGEYVLTNTFSDSGIVYLPNRPYLISVMVQGNPDEPMVQERAYAAQLMQDISHLTYQYLLQEDVAR